MLIHPWDKATPQQWRPWLADGRNFGQLVANDGEWPVVVPTHFTIRNDQEIVLHLARPNPIRAAIRKNSRVLLTVLDDYTYIPSTWRTVNGQQPEEGVPTSYYAAVQFHCNASLIDEPTEKVALLTEQLADMQPEGGHGDVDELNGPYYRLIEGIFGIHLEVVQVRAKFKFDGHKPAEMRQRISQYLANRENPRDSSARARQQETLTREVSYTDR